MVLFGAMGLMAQEATTATAKKSCSKEKSAACCSKEKADKCCSKNASATSGTASVDTKVLSAAESLADQDENITKRVCAESGATSFYKKEVCEKSGKVSYSQVEYDVNAKQFVNVSPNDIGNADGGKVMKISDVDTKEAVHPKKKACAKGASSKCCSKNAKKTQ